MHVKDNPPEVNKCLFVIRKLKKDDYSLHEIDLFFQSLVLFQLA